MTEPIVRRAIETDVCAVHKLQVDWADQNITYGFVPASEDELRLALGPLFFVAEISGKIVGFIYGRKLVSKGMTIIPEGKTYLNIDDLYVDPDYQNRGIGHLLLHQLCASAKRAELKQAVVYSATKGIHRILNFYEDCGFQSWHIQMFKEL